ncbi:MAG: acetyl-CoA carboxylase, biotin carboxyl carrier protein [Deltaproteobacteria bacterium]|nr:acetyl-CoA carboxylase, biotin carboxyl carrier protein [Deltaproteobacteria bacterium]
MELSEDDVLHILKLIDESKFDYFQLEVGELKITVSKGDPIPLAGSAQPMVVGTAPAVASKPVAASAAPAAAKAVIPAGHLAVTAPILGTFYVAPEPGAPPFVAVGQQVTQDTTCGLIEVMKVFNSVRAGVKGTVVEVVAPNGGFVEFGQVLIIVKP